MYPLDQLEGTVTALGKEMSAVHAFMEERADEEKKPVEIDLAALAEFEAQVMTLMLFKVVKFRTQYHTWLLEHKHAKDQAFGAIPSLHCSGVVFTPLLYSMDSNTGYLLSIPSLL